MPVLSVAETHDLAARDKLDGRLAAVGGYWAMYFYPCPSGLHEPVLRGFCYGGQFADTADEVAQAGGPNSGSSPLIVPETGSGQILWSSGAPDAVLRVVLIVHAGDSRAFQCQPQEFSECHERLVVDRVAWSNGNDVPLGSPNSDLSLDRLRLTPEAAASAGLQPNEQLLTAYPIDSTAIDSIDPRFSGKTTDLVWYVRAARGSPDADGVVDGVDRLVSDTTGVVRQELGLQVASDLEPARVILDIDQSSHRNTGDGSSSHPRVEVSSAGVVIVKDYLGSSTSPLALTAGTYELRAYVGNEFGPAAHAPDCTQSITVAPGTDVTYLATFKANSCSWALAPETQF
jgi:hypothetical protein